MDKKKLASKLIFFFMIITICLLCASIVTGCGNGSDSSSANKANIVDVPTVKIYKDRGDAADAFFAASRAELPTLLYFYTDS